MFAGLKARPGLIWSSKLNARMQKLLNLILLEWVLPLLVLPLLVLRLLLPNLLGPQLKVRHWT